MTAILKTLPPPQQDPAVLEIAERFLTRVRSGESVGFVLIEVSKQGGPRYSAVGVPDRYNVVGYLSTVIYELHADAAAQG